MSKSKKLFILPLIAVFSALLILLGVQGVASPEKNAMAEAVSELEAGIAALPEPDVMEPYYVSAVNEASAKYAALSEEDKAKVNAEKAEKLVALKTIADSYITVYDVTAEKTNDLSTYGGTASGTVEDATFGTVLHRTAASYFTLNKSNGLAANSADCTQIVFYIYNNSDTEVNGHYDEDATWATVADITTLKANQWTKVTVDVSVITATSQKLYFHVAGDFYFSDIFGIPEAVGNTVSELEAGIDALPEPVVMGPYYVSAVNEASAEYAALSEEDKAKVNAEKAEKLVELKTIADSYKTVYDVTAEEANVTSTYGGTPSGTFEDATFGTVLHRKASSAFALEKGNGLAENSKDCTQIVFYIYNNSDADVNDGYYAQDNPWKKIADITTLKAKQWTKVTVDVSVITATSQKLYFNVAGDFYFSDIFGIPKTGGNVEYKTVYDVTAKKATDQSTYGGTISGTVEDAMFGTVLHRKAEKTFALDKRSGLAANSKDCTQIVFYIYNNSDTNVSGYYAQDKPWTKVADITLKAKQWTKVTVDVSVITATNEKLYFNVAGDFYFSDIFGVKKRVITINDENGALLAQGADAESYDPSVLNTDKKVFTGFSCNGNLYKTVSEASASVDGDITLVAETVTLYAVKGASVRLSGVAGMRFAFYVDADIRTFGAILSAPVLFNGMEFTKEALDENSVHYKEIIGGTEGFNSVTEENLVRFNVVLQNIKESNFKNYFAARAYVTVTYHDGSTANIYSAYNRTDNSRSVSEVAKAAYENQAYLDENGNEIPAYKAILETYMADEVVTADAPEKLSSGSDTGNNGTIGVANDATYGKVWTLTATDPAAVAANESTKNGDFHLSPNPDVTGYKRLFFHIYNPTDNDIPLVCYTTNRTNPTTTVMKAKQWTTISVDTSVYGNNFFFIISDANAYWTSGTWLISGIRGIKTDQTVTETYNEFTVKALNGAFIIDSGKTIDFTAYSGPSAGIVHDNRTEKEVDGKWVLYRTTSTLENIKKYFDAGFKYWCADDCWFGRAYLKELAGMEYDHDAYWALDMAAEYYRVYGEDCPVILTFDGLASAMQGNFKLNNAEVTESDYKNWLKSAVETVKNYTPSNGGKNFFAGLQLADEPTLSQAESYAYMFNYLTNDLHLLRDGYVLNSALFGMIGSSAQIGSDGYESYINTILDNVSSELVLYDNYPFKIQKTGTTSSSVLVESYLQNMQCVSSIAAQRNLQAGVCIQSMAFNDSGNNSLNYGLTNQSQISMQVYAALAYGYTYLNYFVYTTPMNLNDNETYTDSPVDWGADNKTVSYNAMYDWVKNVNNEVKNFENVLLSMEYLGTKAIGVTGVTSYSGAPSAAADYAALIGCFAQNDINGYLIANAYDPVANAGANTVSINIGTDFAVVYLQGVPSVMQTENGTLTVSLEAGAGAFVLPVAAG